MSRLADALRRNWLRLALGYLAVGFILVLVAKPPVESVVADMGVSGVVDSWAWWTIGWPMLLTLWAYDVVMERVFGLST